MRPTLTLVTAATLTVSGSSVLAASEAGHARHHPAKKMATVGTTKYHQNIGRMMEMPQKRQAAKTPEERAALMKEHMESAQNSMNMLDREPAISSTK